MSCCRSSPQEYHICHPVSSFLQFPPVKKSQFEAILMNYWYLGHLKILCILFSIQIIDCVKGGHHLLIREGLIVWKYLTSQ